MANMMWLVLMSVSAEASAGLPSKLEHSRSSKRARSEAGSVSTPRDEPDVSRSDAQRQKVFKLPYANLLY